VKQSANDTLLEFSGVGLSVGRREILKEVSLKVGRGEVVTLIGPNGAGKTTLLRVGLGLLRPTEGEVYLRPDLRTGYMPQRLQLDPTLPLTVRRFLGLAGSRGSEELLPILREVGAERVLDSPFGNLSGGELQRVLLARALLREPDLLVLDEPVQGVDVQGQAELFQLITRIRDRRGCAVFMVSHDLHLVMASTDRVVCLNRHVCCTGSPEAVTADPGFVELFGPLVVQNLALYAHDSEHRHNKKQEDFDG